jgi:hypothetical protein
MEGRLGIDVGPAPGCTVDAAAMPAAARLATCSALPEPLVLAESAMALEMCLCTAASCSSVAVPRGPLASRCRACIDVGLVCDALRWRLAGGGVTLLDRRDDRNGA